MDEVIGVEGSALDIKVTADSSKSGTADTLGLSCLGVCGVDDIRKEDDKD